MALASLWSVDTSLGSSTSMGSPALPSLLVAAHNAKGLAAPRFPSQTMAKRVIPLLLLVAPASATKIQAVNLCEGSMELHIGSHGEPITIAQGAGHNLELADGNNAAYRYGASYQATQAEFANVDSSTWYDISIIPSGNTGPGSCTSLEDCKAVTGGTGFNVAMQIVPSIGGGTSSTDSCRVLSCLEDGCDDAYHFPDQDARTHSCSAGIEFQVLFCGNSTEISDSAADYWVDANSSTGSGSHSNSTGSSAVSSQSDSNPQVEPQSETTPAPSSDKEKTVTTGSEKSSGTSAAVYVAAGVAAVVVVLVVAAFVFKRRHAIAFWWETRNYKEKESRSSDELGFVRVSDDAMI
ncbi:Thaumatin-like protein [Phytophthora citrophthora]|uniref:Thaumatin-like protein n=1 Tax=Phytophthora citrophthora TaxID=4793 RepID=A0AAD9G3N6_9STRA|nr:Thaumatin-like protein [Phytophthora citrophthora]